MPALVVITSLRPSWSKPWALWTRQLVNSFPIWEEISSTSIDETEGAYHVLQ